ncbi:transketolase family protein [Schnuerera ultunensis]|uniref:Putative transketolase C-terminal section n=1 Tax=[Clostridium] ultunense Esp TaxID=1288971 RepID=A0A1M4PL77_9FIRM|nr:transketolase family protein [Schnuerera ultunensis]SHD76201.1 putative transketolase C-terminal section [[Clostridium] ultunense Esp]
MSKLVATRVAFGEALAKLGEVNDKVVALNADLSGATMTNIFEKKFPGRFFNAGIAEANMTGMAVGLSEMGFIPFVSTFAIFGTGRAYEQVRNSIGYPHSNVKLAMSHSGINLGEDGGSHQAIEDIALMRVIPGMTIICPSDFIETYKAVFAAASFDGPVYIRLARMPSPVLKDMPFEIGKGNVLKDGDDLVIFTCGLMVHKALNVAERLKEDNISVAVVNLHTIKPIDKNIIKKYANNCKAIVTLEEHSVIGGLGDAVAEVLIKYGSHPIKKLGIQDKFGQSGKPEELFRHYRLDEDSILEDIKGFINSKCDRKE